MQRGVMVAASVCESSDSGDGSVEGMGHWHSSRLWWGFWIRFYFAVLLDHLIRICTVTVKRRRDKESRLARTTMLVLAVTFVSRRMAVGVVYAGYLTGNTKITAIEHWRFPSVSQSRTFGKTIISCASGRGG